MKDEKKYLEEYLAKRQKRGRIEEEAPAEEKTILHGNMVVANIFIIEQNMSL